MPTHRISYPRLVSHWTFGVLTFCGGIASGFAADSPAVAPEMTKETVVYKSVGPTKIEADVYRRNGDTPRPVLVWIHGGALIMGNRHGVPGNLMQLARENDYVVISLDYRLAPEVKLPAIIDDIKDAFRWIHVPARQQFYLDTSRLVVAGGSAGGYLTLMTGIAIEPRPTALLAYYGYGDIDAPWYIQPSEFYRKQPLVSREEALGVVGGPVTTGADSGPRGKYYLYLRQNGLWTREVAGFDPVTERAKIDPYCPVRNVTPQYPPTMLLHGTADTDVPYQESADMAAELKRQGVEHELITVDGGGHGLGGKSPEVIDAHKRAVAFVKKKLG